MLWTSVSICSPAASLPPSGDPPLFPSRLSEVLCGARPLLPSAAGLPASSRPVAACCRGAQDEAAARVLLELSYRRRDPNGLSRCRVSGRGLHVGPLSCWTRQGLLRKQTLWKVRCAEDLPEGFDLYHGENCSVSVRLVASGAGACLQGGWGKEGRMEVEPPQPGPCRRMGFPGRDRGPHRSLRSCKPPFEMEGTPEPFTRGLAMPLARRQEGEGGRCEPPTR